MLPILASFGLNFIKDLITENGEELVKEGIKKVTGIDLDREKELTPEQVQIIKDNEFRLKELDFKTLQLDYDQRNKEEEEKTKRWASDNSSDSRFAKLVRPASMVYLLFVITVLAIIDGNVSEFTIKEAWVELFTALTITVTGGYFTLRTYEKRTGTSKWK